MLRAHEREVRDFAPMVEGEWRTIRWRGTRRKCCQCGCIERDEYRIRRIGGRNFLEIRGWREKGR